MSAPVAVAARPPVAGALPRASARPRVGWAYAVASALTVAALLAVMNPAFGSRARVWPWELDPGRWTPESSGVFMLGSAALAFLACACLRPSAARGVVAACAAAVPVVAFGAGRNLFLSVATFAAPTVAGVAGGALYGRLGAARARAGRWAAAGAAAVLAAILLYPLYTEPTTSAGTRYTSWLLEVGREAALLAEVGETSDLWPYLLQSPTVLVLLYTVLAVAGILALVTRSRALAWVGAGALLLSVAWPLGHGLVDGAVSRDFYAVDDSTFAALSHPHAGLRLAGEALLAYFLPCVLGVFGATADVVRGRATVGLEPPPAPTDPASRASRTSLPSRASRETPAPDDEEAPSA